MSEETSIWVDDKLKRKEEALGILKYIIGHRKQSAENSLVMNINADWGFGKSYMLNQMHEELASKKVPTVFFNAWNNDFEKDPLLAFLLELNESLSAFKDEAKVDEAKLKRLGIGLLKVAGKAASKKLLGMGADELAETFSDSNNSGDKQSDSEKSVSADLDKLFDKFTKEHSDTKSIIKNIKQDMKDIASKFHDSQVQRTESTSTDSDLYPLIIFIDELDRCRPNYAIELLESIKHLFEIPGVYFLIATDTQQLAHSFKVVYGSDFDTTMYLKRFFDLEYKMKAPNTQDYCEFLLIKFIQKIPSDIRLFSPYNPDCNHEENTKLAISMDKISKKLNLSLRDQKQCLIVLEAIVVSNVIEHKVYHFFFLYFLIAVKHRKEELYVNLKKNVFKQLASNERSAVDSIGDYFEDTKNIGGMTLLTEDIVYTNNGSTERMTIDNIIKFYFQNINQNLGSSHSRPEAVQITRAGSKQRYISDPGLNYLKEYFAVVESAGQYS